MSISALVHAIVEGRSLTEAQAQEAMRALLAGESTPVLTAAFLTALRMKGETVDELTGFARAMRAAAVVVPIEDRYRPVLDTCGTGGNGTSTFNISTVTAFVVAGAGVRVAKHGNRSISSRCGSADVLEALGVRTAVEPEIVARAIREAGIATEDEELMIGLVAIAAPVRNYASEVVAATSLSANRSVISVEALAGQLSPHLIAAANRLSARLGFRRADEPHHALGGLHGLAFEDKGA